MPSHQWVAREDEEVAAYRKERERCQLAIRNVLQNKVVSRRVREGFVVDRKEARVRASWVRWEREGREKEARSMEDEGRGEEVEGRSSVRKRGYLGTQDRAALEAERYVPASFSIRGGYVMRRR